MPVALAQSPSAHRRGLLLTSLGATAWSTAGLFQRAIAATPATQVAGRALVAGVALLVLTTLTTHVGPVAAARRLGRAGAGITLSYAVASGSFLFALAQTTVAHVLLIQASTPLIAALIARALLGEPIHRRTWVAMALAAIGIGVMVGGSLGGGSVLGDLLSVVNAVAFAFVIVSSRRARPGTTSLAGCFAQFLVVLAVAPFADIGSVGPHAAVGILTVGIVQMFLGITLFTAGARLIPAAEASVISLLEVVLAPLWVWIAFSESPTRATLLGGAVLLVGLVGHVALDLRDAHRGDAEAALG